MKIIANYTRKLIDDKGNIEITFTVDNWAFKRSVNDLTKQPYSLEIKVPKSKRSIDQNRLLWDIIGQISKELDINDLDIYAYLIEKTNAKYDEVVVKYEAIERLRSIFRAVKVIGPTKEHGETFVKARTYYGSSNFNTKEMTELINHALDYAEQSGVDTELYEGR